MRVTVESTVSPSKEENSLEYKRHGRNLQTDAQLAHSCACLHTSIKDKASKSCTSKEASTVDRYSLCRLFHQLSLSTGRSTTVVVRVRTVVEREKHLRLVCNVLWKMHNFGAFTSELCSSTLLKL